LYGKPEIKAHIDNTSEFVRSTTLCKGEVKIDTVEHVLSALAGLNIDNVLIEINGNEPPILDGSAKYFVNLIQEGEPVEQDAPRECWAVDRPISVTSQASSLIILPYDGFKITCTSADDRGIHTQHLALDIDPHTYVAHLAPARTFVVYEDIEPLLKQGKLQGGSLDCAIVIKGDKVLSKEPLRFRDEFVRHKMLDIIGDLSLLGCKIKGHIVAVRTGHALNAKLTRELWQLRQASLKHKGTAAPLALQSEPLTETSLPIQRILNTLPHRYPFLMVDRVVSVVSDTELIAIKNVSINEPFFQGHFPGHPVMPGVLQLEAMAQAAGILLYKRIGLEKKIAYFMSCDKVKFRKPVVPGDQLQIHVHLKPLQRTSIGAAEVTCKVGGKVVSSAELMFGIAPLQDQDGGAVA
jgi:UDP-3-O-[3-hydroxymyristoyl] N-acetylglucosamine deacetylase/3-hydroxyacyl-[acyl-carrier-protein] dehydratase